MGGHIELSAAAVSPSPSLSLSVLLLLLHPSSPLPLSPRRHLVISDRVSFAAAAGARPVSSLHAPRLYSAFFFFFPEASERKKKKSDFQQGGRRGGKGVNGHARLMMAAAQFVFFPAKVALNALSD